MIFSMIFVSEIPWSTIAKIGHPILAINPIVDRIRDPVNTTYAPARDWEGSAVVKGRVN